MTEANSQLEQLINSLNALTTAITTKASDSQGTGPLGAFQNIGSSWEKSFIALSSKMALDFGNHMIQQIGKANVADIRGKYDPSSASSMRAANYDPAGPIKNIPFIGSIIQNEVETRREEMQRQASIIGLMQRNQMNSFGQLNTLAEQVTSQEISLNRQYTPAQVSYQQRLIQPATIEKNSSEWWDQKNELYKKAKETQAEYERVSDPMTGEISKRQKAREAYTDAQEKYDMYIKEKPMQERKDAYAIQLREQAARQYALDTVGQYTPLEQQNIYSTAVAPQIGGLPEQDKSIDKMEITNTELKEIKNLLHQYLEKTTH